MKKLACTKSVHGKQLGGFRFGHSGLKGLQKLKITTVDTVIQDFRDGLNIFRRPSVELLIREIERLRNVNDLKTDALNAYVKWMAKIE